MRSSISIRLGNRWNVRRSLGRSAGAPRSHRSTPSPPPGVIRTVVPVPVVAPGIVPVIALPTGIPVLARAPKRKRPGSSLSLGCITQTGQRHSSRNGDGYNCDASELYHPPRLPNGLSVKLPKAVEVFDPARTRLPNALAAKLERPARRIQPDTTAAHELHHIHHATSSTKGALQPPTAGTGDTRTRFGPLIRQYESSSRKPGTAPRRGGTRRCAAARAGTTVRRDRARGVPR